MKAYVYILKCADNTYYTGYTVDLTRRLKMHNDKKASKYTRGRVPVKYVYTHECEDKIQAQHFERKIKKFTKEKKEKLIQGLIDLD